MTCACGCGSEAKPGRTYVHGHNARIIWTPELFWAEVDCSGDGCWPWLRCCNADGYGVTHRDYAHRIAFKMAFGEIPDGFSVLHTCDNPPCCRPLHLFLGTQRDNIDDMMAKGRQVRGDEHWTRRMPERLDVEHLRSAALARWRR